MAVLYRTNALSRAFEGALMRAKIPYEIVGDVGFYARAEIKIALAYLRLSAFPDDRSRTRPYAASSTSRGAASARRRSRSSRRRRRSATSRFSPLSKRPLFLRKPEMRD